MKKISINNGNSFVDVEMAIASIDWDIIVNMMDDDVRDCVHNEIAPCSNADFLRRYLELADTDLIIG